MDKFIHDPTPYLFLSTTCDEIWLCVSVIQMKNRLVSGSHCNIYIYNPPIKVQGIANNVGLTFSVGDTTLRFTTTLNKMFSV
jgi:hypothetical protein